jgi:uncharacterized protein YjbI with pentapeptide repeats
VANQEHLDILKQGVDVWNKWREEHTDTQPDLSEANLCYTNLSYINLCEAVMNGVDLSGSTLVGANLVKAEVRVADISGANFDDANLNGADIRYASFENGNFKRASLRGVWFHQSNLNGSNFSEADLSEAMLNSTRLIRVNFKKAVLKKVELHLAHLRLANLREADLSDSGLEEADLKSATLDDANLSRARIMLTSFGDCDLRVIKGLDTIIHEGPSPISITTIYLSHGNIPEAFLKGAGVDDTFIAYARSLVGKPIEYYSCFISYSNRDEAFARRLYANLQNNNVRCWYAPEDMKTGDVIRSRIDEAIRVHDKLLLVLSQHSVESSWVEKEVETAFERERQQKRHVLIPVLLDDVVMQTSTSWAADIRRMRHITDFTDWKDHDAYQKAFGRLLRDLKAET